MNQLIKAYITIGLLMVCQIGFGQSDQNYVRTHTVQVKGITNSATDLNGKPNTEVTTTTNIVDGFGRPIQSISKRSSPGSLDIVQHIQYDDFGRKNLNFLPYTGGANGQFKDGANAAQNTFYDNHFSGTSGDYAFSEITYEPSPLNRVSKSYASGAAWSKATSGGKPITYGYEVNLASEVLLWILIDDIPVSNLYYNAGELYKNVTTDEQNHKAIEFVDKQGRIVLKRVQAHENGQAVKWADTYYIYDDFNNLRCVLPPEAMNAIETEGLGVVLSGYTLLESNFTVTASTGLFAYMPEVTVTVAPTITLSPTLIIKPYRSISQNFLDQWAFQYTYDYRNRMIEKQVPGAGLVYMVYDNRDRLILTQDADQRISNKWMFTKYDQLNRPIITGEKVLAGSASSIRTNVANHTTFYETYLAGGLVKYTNNAYPTSVTESDIHTVTYYDNYDFTALVFTDPPAGRFTADSQKIIPSDFVNVKGLVTGSKTKILGTTNDYVEAVNFYDDRYRLIQSKVTNHKNGNEVQTTQYDFVGRVRKTYLEHHNPAGDITNTAITREFTYDHVGRLMTVKHQLNTEPVITLVKNEYNELGELIDKKLHATNGIDFEQSVDYRYNMRGWLTSINNAGLLDSEANASDDYFGVELAYTSTMDALNPVLAYNGNISAMKWSGDAAGEQLGYGYTYDAMNRLKIADHRIVGMANTDAFDVNTLNYDLNGNIESLTRKGKDGGSMDILGYTYNGNQLQKVSDTGDVSEGFKDGNTSGNDYGYDANGNMIMDLNKGVGSGEKLINEDFEQGGANWIVSKDNDNVVSFTDGKLISGASSTSRIIRQDDVLEVGKTYKVNVNFEKQGPYYIRIESGNGNYVHLYESGSFELTAQDTWLQLTLAIITEFSIESISVKLMGIEYNHLNLPSKVTKDDGQYIKYIYDAAGIKLAQEVYDASDVLQKRTDYISEFIYEQEGVNPSELAIIQHEEGRIVPNTTTGGFEYQYHLKDHLGNTRVTFTTEPKTHEFNAFYEDATTVTKDGEDISNDMDSFEAMGNIFSMDIHDVTDAGSTYTKVQKLTGADGSIVGSILTIPVGKGDLIDATVSAKYLEATTSPNNAINTVAGSLIAALTGSSTAANFDGVATSTTSNSDGSFIGALGENISTSEPMAFINLMFLSEEAVDLTDDTFSYGQITSSSSNAHHEIALPEAFEAPSAGYVVVYLSNESNFLTEVYFDDLKVTVNESKIIQTDDYYPFGLQMAGGFQRSTGKENKWRFQGQEHIDELDLHWDEFKWRNSDPSIGRFFSVDPLAESYVYNSPYAFSENNVTGHIELEGLEKVSVIDGKMVVTMPPDATSTSQNRRLNPYELPQKQLQIPKSTLGIARNDIYHPEAFSKADRAAQLGVDIGEAATGIYALKSLPKYIKNIPSLVKSLTKTSAKVDDVAESAMKSYGNIDEVWSGCDCSEIAEDIFSQTGSGNVLELTNKGGLKVLQNGVEETFDYHQVFTKDGYVYDPRYSKNPVKFDNYMDNIQGTNSNLKIIDVTPEL